MTLTALAPRPIVDPAPSGEPADSPTALLHLALDKPSDLPDAASTIYAQTRKGRRVVAVVSGEPDLIAALSRRLDAIGLSVAGPDDAPAALIHEPVVLVRGISAPRREARCPSPRLRVALAGCGIVGGGLIERLTCDPRVDLVGILVRDPTLERPDAPPPHLLVTDPAALLAREPDVIVDVLSDASTGLALTRAALTRGVHVVSANKQAVGADLSALQALARPTGARLAFSASVGGGVPMIETLSRALAHGPVARIEGVLNGTVNYLLNRLAAGTDFVDALAQARAAGFAEEDASSDLEGRDAAAKLAILSTLAFGRAAPISTQPLMAETPVPLGLRQIARADATSASVTLAASTDPLFADLTDEANALRVTCADGRVFTCRGRGAGRAPTCASVWADIEDLIEA